MLFADRVKRESDCRLSLVHIHCYGAQHAFQLRGAVDGAQLVLSKQLKEIAADVQLRQTADEFAVLHQIGHLHRRCVVPLRRHIAAGGNHHIHCLARSQRTQRGSGGVRVPWRMDLMK